MKIKFKINKFLRFELRSEYLIQVEVWKWLKLFNSVPFIKKTLVNHLYIWIWLFWLTLKASQWMKTNSKLVNLRISAKVRVCDFRQNLKMTKTSYFCSIHQENPCKSCLHSNLIILIDFHRFTVDEDKLQN